jgi:hypothetical protein
MNKFLFIIIALFITSPCFAQPFMQDDFVIRTLAEKKIEKPRTNLDYNYLDTTKIKIPMRIKETVKSETNIYEGQELEFRVTKNIYFKGSTILRKNQTVKAKVETIIKNGMNGIPASIVLGDFEIDGLEKNKLTVSYEIYGIDLSLLVFPLKWALTILPPTGSLTNFIVGGHAKIKDSKTIEIYYFPFITAEI